ncbi:LacI family DNA-binding transcriptional regulator [Caulobacter sp. RL271]|uniref:LacI family DNA-binding transcriptional regulator n=1 Tax=Caulobacter segnis TaxID=88688 RepID=A0ABY4ZTU2_9CAUL|nr:LacI family DNA-binding transcriptional regulator [Caulobacter segnis]USQ95427.1 LacI family DNA-binding transcriptional regulator [Caulobacter segnis]
MARRLFLARRRRGLVGRAFPARHEAMGKSGDKGVSIKDIAREAGVSIATVSRVLNRGEGAGPEVRGRVLEIVERLGYRPNVSARALSGRRNYLIGVLFLRLGGYHYLGEVQLGATRACHRAGYHLLVEQLETAEGMPNPEALAAFVRSAAFDGLILTPPLSDDLHLLAAIEDAAIPYVRLAPNSNEARSPYVWMDDQAAAREQTLALWDMGHRRIAFIDGPAGHRAAVRRKAGYLAAMAERGLAVPANWIAQGDFFGMSGFSATEALLALEPAPTAIFAGNDEMAVGALAAAAKHRVAVPERLSIVGFDNSPAGETSWPPLTTVHQPIAEMAEAAAEMLIGGFGDQRFRARVEEQKLDYRLICRQSAAPPSA